MKINLSILLFWGIVFLILSTQGILMFNVFKLVGMWELKSAVQPLGVFLIFLYFFLSKANGYQKFSQVDFILLAYFAFSCIFLFINADGFNSIYIAIREVFLLYILILLFNQMSLSTKQWDWILLLVFVLVLANIFFTFLIYIIGLERYMILLTGEFFWGNHPEYKFKISNFLGSKLFRVPGLVGEAAALGHFGVFSFFLLKNHKKYKYLAFLALIPVAFCFIRSVYVVLVIYYLLFGVSTNKRFARFVLYSLPFLPVVLFFMVRFRLLDLESLMMRLDFWQSRISVEYNFLYGGAIGKVGGAATTGGFEDTIDNYWLFLLFSVGIIGIILILTFFFEKLKKKRDLAFMVVAVGISGLFVTLTQSLVVLCFIPLLFMNYNFLKSKNETFI